MICSQRWVRKRKINIIGIKKNEMYEVLVLLSCCTILAWIFYHLDYLRVKFPDCEGAILLEDLLKKSKTGDLILLSGRGRDSSVVKGWSGCLWSHIGMIVEDLETKDKYLYNSDACSSRRNASDGKYKEGVQLNDLKVYLETYPGYAFYCPLIGNPETNIIEAIRALNGINFNRDWIELLRCTHGKGGGCLGSKQERVDLYFCSQLVAQIYYFMGVIGDRIPFNEYHPASFVGELDADWINNCHAGELLWVVR